MACPICQSNSFYTKNPDDEFDVFEFTCKDGAVTYDEEDAEDEAPPMSKDPEIYCQRCAWHGKITKVK